jgi:hypothetical protein
MSKILQNCKVGQEDEFLGRKSQTRKLYGTENTFYDKGKQIHNSRRTKHQLFMPRTSKISTIRIMRIN